MKHMMAVVCVLAVASLAGAPLGHDYVMLSLSDRLKPWDIIARRLTAAAEGDFAIAIYNPASRSRWQQLADARDLLLTYRDAETPVVVGRAVVVVVHGEVPVLNVRVAALPAESSARIT